MTDQKRDTDSTCWAAVAMHDDYLVAVEWRRGEACPTVASHRELLRSARGFVESYVQETAAADLDGFAFRSAGDDDGLLVALFDPSRPDWLPEGANTYTN
jgi:hypothetical protein